MIYTAAELEEYRTLQAFVERARSRVNCEIAPEWFHEAQMRAWRSLAVIIAICAGWQSGKTVFLPWWLLREIQRKGPGDYGAFSATYKLLSRKFLPELKKVFAPYCFYRSSDMQFVFTKEGEMKIFGSVQTVPTVIQLGYAENPDSLESATMKAIAWDEPGQRLVPEQSFLTVQSRLMVNRGRVCLSSRPYEFNWFERLVSSGLNRKDSRVEVIQFESWANPMNPPKDDAWWAQLQHDMPMWKYQMLYLGLFTRPAGAIFDNLDANLHRLPRLKIGEKWPKRAGLDFGDNNTAAVVGAHEPREGLRPRRIVYGEYWPNRILEEKEHAVEILKIAGQIPHAYGGSHQEGGWRTAYGANGLPVYEPIHSGAGSVELRIQAIYSALADGSLAITEDCPMLWDQLMDYSRPMDSDGNMLPGIDGKAKYHLVDALGYWLINEYVEYGEPVVHQQSPAVHKVNSQEEDEDIRTHFRSGAFGGSLEKEYGNKQPIGPGVPGYRRTGRR